MLNFKDISILYQIDAIIHSSKFMRKNIKYIRINKNFNNSKVK